MKRLRTRVTTVLATVAVFALLAASPASASAAFSLDSNSNGDYRVQSSCGAVAGVTTSFNSITYVVEAEAVATATNGAVGVGTGVICAVKDASTGTTYGTVAGGLPGSVAVALGEVTIPMGVTVKVVVCGSAVYSDGGSVSC